MFTTYPAGTELVTNLNSSSPSVVVADGTTAYSDSKFLPKTGTKRMGNAPPKPTTGSALGYKSQDQLREYINQTMGGINPDNIVNSLKTEGYFDDTGKQVKGIDEGFLSSYSTSKPEFASTALSAKQRAEQAATNPTPEPAPQVAPASYVNGQLVGGGDASTPQYVAPPAPIVEDQVNPTPTQPEPLPPPQPIPNPIVPPTTVGETPAPNLPAPQAGNANAVVTENLNNQIEQAKKQVLEESARRSAEYQTKIDALTKEQKDYQALQDTALGGIDETTKKTIEAKQAALDEEKKRFDENFNANQNLIGEMENLLNTGNALIEEMRGTTGLASILNPRIAKTMSDVTARAGVLSSVISARNGQMSYAQQQLGTTYDALSSISTDQINYYKTVISFYDAQEGEARADILKLTGEQKDYLDVKLKLLDDDLSRLQDTKDLISKAMLDPDTATQYAMAGVTLNDSVEQIAQKLATYGYSQELKNLSNSMATNGYTSTPISGVTAVPITDSRGGVKNWYKIPSNTPASTSIISKDGRQVLINDLTGAVIADLGVSPASASAQAASNQQATLNPGDVRIDSAGKVIASNPVAKVQEAVATASTTGTTGTRTPTAQELIDAYAKNGGKALSQEQIAQLYGTTTTAPVKTSPAVTIDGAPTGFTKADITNVETALKTGSIGGQKIANPMGSDGFIDPAGYVSLMNYWISKGGTKQAFFSTFPYKTYINPANTWVWAQLGIANPYVKAPASSSSSTAGRTS